jgi:hypothetical protein
MMKKQIQLLFGLLLSHFVYSQTIPVGDYKYYMDLDVYTTNNKAIACDNTVAVDFIFYQIGSLASYQIDLDTERYAHREFTVTATKKLYRIKTNAQRNWENILGCTNNGLKSKFTDFLPVCDKNYGNIIEEWEGSFKLKRTPQLTIINPNPGYNYFEVDDPNGIVINSYSGFDASDYNWEYIDPLNVAGGWIPFIDTQTRKYSGLSSLTLTLADINPKLKSNKSFYQSTLSIRQVGVGTGCNYASKQVDYTLVKTPPLVKSITPKNTQCAYSKDGTIEIEFNRPLETDEKFGPNNLIYQTDKIIPDVAIVANPNSNTKFTISGLPPETYKLTYQTNFLVGVNVYNSERKTIESIVVASSPALKYTARMAQPKCATDGGDIAINVRGGVPPYSYKITATTVVNGTKSPYTTSKVFTNSAGIPLPDHGLPNGDYIIPLDSRIEGKVTIQVTDSHGCVDGDKKAP